ncbi:MAG: hypothetical protein HQ556_14505 [Candidatus Marinimicrobia bacterium]|nr:hypothetical protein [Candidatus Neomarinimicrobiota bacterium]
MHIVDASNYVLLDASRLVTPDPDASNPEEESSPAFALDGPSLVMVNNMNLIDAELADECCEILNGIVRSYPDSLFLFDEKHVYRFEEEHRLRLPTQNTSIGNVVNSEPTGDGSLNLFPPHWILIRDPQHFTKYESLRNYTWIIIRTLMKERTPKVLQSVAKIIAYCNEHNKHVCTIPYLRLDPLDEVIRDELPGQNHSLYYEFPKTDNHMLMVVNDAAVADVKKAQNMIEHWVQINVFSTMVIAYELYKLRSLSRKVGQRAFWEVHFGVSSSDEFASKIIGISRSTANRYIQAISVSEKLLPGIMDEVAAGENAIPKKALSCSRFQSVHPFLDDIENAQEDKQQAVKEMLLDPNVTAKTLKTHLNEHFKREASEPSPFIPLKYFDGVANKVSNQIDESRLVYLDQYLAAMIHLCDPNAEHFAILVNPYEIAIEEVQAVSDRRVPPVTLGQA